MLFDIVNPVTANGSLRARRDFACAPLVSRDARPVQGLSASRRGGAYARLVFARRFFPVPGFFGGGLNTMPSSFMPSGSVK